jgi:hypothetical protein
MAVTTPRKISKDDKGSEVMAVGSRKPRKTPGRRKTKTADIARLHCEVQVSMNLIAPEVTGPDKVYDSVAQYAEIDRAELVGLVPSRTLAAIPRQRWAQLDLSTETTIEWNLAERNRKLRA